MADDTAALLRRLGIEDADVYGYSMGADKPVLLIIGDSDIARPEHAVQLFRLLGGGVEGTSAGLPRSQLAVLPGTTHLSVVERRDWLVSMITEFLDSPISSDG
jgi:pimeloyl-ACP methyl ester carboxylesterase